MPGAGAEREEQNLVASGLAAAQGGSPRALGELLEGCRQYLLLIANQELDTDLQAKIGPSDIVQNTFLEANRDFGQFRGQTEAEFKAWLRGILLHNLDEVRRSFWATQKRDLQREKRAEGTNLEALGLDQPTPGSALAAEEQVERMRKAVEQLPEHYQQVVRLRHQAGCSFEEIGQRTGRSAEAARKVWARAIEQLKLLLQSSHEPS